MSDLSSCWRSELEDAVARAEIPGRWVDVGIGSYDYCGAVGVHSEMAFEVAEDVPLKVEWLESFGERGDPLEYDFRVDKTIYLDEERVRSSDISLRVRLVSVAASRKGWEGYHWKATYEVSQ
jgi:hypothetical protein